jgi:hypothetical protein
MCGARADEAQNPFGALAPAGRFREQPFLLPAQHFFAKRTANRLTPKPAGGKLACMQTLGLSGESKRSDGWLKSIFWPTVENAWDVNYLGQQGFWICLVIGLLRALVGVFSGNPLLLVVYLVMALVFLLGGMGVREASWPAAAMMFAIFFSDILYTMAVGRLPGVISIFFAGILLSNVRAAFLASEWRPVREDEDRPTRFNETFWDRFVDQWPAKAWPVLQVPFFSLAALLLVLSLAGVGAALYHRLGALPGPLHP